ncbi:MAG: hypothetical protein FWB83_10925 [Treponema sp.]|nr:hypothetical protein [Treponema sp.]
MKKIFLFYSAVIFSLIAGSCVVSPAGNEEMPAKYDAQFRGEWIRMDTGDLWYISGTSILINNSYQGQDVKLTKTSENVITALRANNQTYTLFASRVANAGFNAHVVLLDEDETPQGAVRSLVGKTGQIPLVKIINPSQPDIILTAEPDPVTGKITVAGVIPGDKVEIIPDDSMWEDVTIQLTPGFGEDQNLGIVPLTKGANHKASIKMRNTEDNIYELYADNVARNYIIEIENVGTTNSTGASYSVLFDNDDFSLDSGNLNGPLGTIMPGAKKDIQLSLRSAPIDNQSKIKEIKVQITYIDTIESAVITWNDTVSVKYYKQAVPIFIRSQNPVQGIMKTPKGETLYFKTEKAGSDYSCTKNVPWSGDDYIVAFLGATTEAGSETVYSLGIGEQPSTDWNWLFDNGKQYEYLNICNKEETAPELNLTDNRTFMYYLYNTAVQYFKIKMGNEPPSLGNAATLITVTNTVHWNEALTTILNNGSGTNDYPKNYEIRVSGNISIPGNPYYTFGENIQNIIVTLTGSGTLSLSGGGSGSLLTIGYDQTLAIDGVNLILQGRANNNRPVIYVTDGGVLELMSGTIRGNTVTAVNFGGGVSVYKGTFVMTGGTISGNKVTAADSCGGGVSVVDGTFFMLGGTISGNTSGGFGGGVDVSSGGTFEMSGGNIRGNTAGYGGGVSVYVGNFTKSGGVIFGNNEGDNSNTAVIGHAAYWDNNIYYYNRGTTLGENDNISTGDTSVGWE